jgi:hypothetical protein
VATNYEECLKKPTKEKLSKVIHRYFKEDTPMADGYLKRHAVTLVIGKVHN